MKKKNIFLLIFFLISLFVSSIAVFSTTDNIVLAQMPPNCRDDGTRDPVIWVRYARNATASDVANYSAVGYYNPSDPSDTILNEGDPLAIIISYNTDFNNWNQARDNPQLEYVRTRDATRYIWRTTQEGTIVSTAQNPVRASFFGEGDDYNSDPGTDIAVITATEAQSYFRNCEPPTDPVDDIDDLAPTSPDEDEDGGDEEEEIDCRDSFPLAVAWAVCAGIEWVDDGIYRLITTINSLLSVGPGEVNTDEMRNAWSYFRNIASLLLMIIGLVMIIGQAISKE